MKYIKPPDFKSVKEFKSYYQKIEEDIAKLLLSNGSAKTAKELQEKINQALNGAVAYLTKKNSDFVKEELPKAFEEGKAGAKAETKLSAKEANAILEKQGFKYAKTAFNYDAYIELQTALKSAGDGLKARVNNVIKDLQKSGNDTIYNVQQAILKDLRDNGVLTVEYANGAKQSLSSYAAMAARSARIESANIGAIGRALQNGTDYVKMTFVPQCCKLCGAYQDKVYCISGKDNRFPALFKTVLKSGYALPHPNCRHEFIPWFIDMEDPKDVKKAINESKIKYDKNGNLVDVRYQKDIKAYAEWQAGNRQLNAEYKEFEQMQAYYKAKGETPPYTTLAGFKRARRRDELSTTFKAWRNREKDAAQYEEWLRILGKENMPKDVDKFIKIKYNNSTKYKNLLRDIDLNRQYNEAVQKGKVTDVGFYEFKNTLMLAKERIVGIKLNGTVVEEVSIHLIERIIGSEKEKRLGIPIEKVAQVLEYNNLIKEKVDKLGRRSWLFHFDKVDVTYNPDKKMVIQCQPNTKRKVKK